jgi:hypothetical protein
VVAAPLTSMTQTFASRLNPEPTRAFLAATVFCDLEHPEVRALAEQLAAGSAGARDTALRMFRWVRDEVLYFFGPWGTTASHTLRVREGTCTNKANLLVALLRAAGIPAAYGVLRVDAQGYWGSVAPGFLRQQASALSTHVHAAAHLDGRWTRCDPSADRQIAEKTSHFCPQNALIEWDATEDRTDAFDPEHVHANLGLHPNIDDLLEKPRRRSNPQLIAIANHYNRFIRSQPPFPDADALLAAYARTDAFPGTLATLRQQMREHGQDPDTLAV